MTTSPLLEHESSTTQKHEGYTKMSSNIDHMLSIPFSQANFLQYSKTLSHQQKLELSKIMKLELLSKKWSDLLFTKKMSIALKKINTDATMMKQVLLTISKIMIQPEYELEEFRNKLPELLKEYKYWAVYWSIYYHTERQAEQLLVLELLEELQQLEQHKGNRETIRLSPLPSSNQQSVEKQDTKIEKKIALLESKAAKETQLRIQLEQELAKIDKQNRIFRQEMEKQAQANEQLKQKFNEALMQIEKQEKLAEAMQRKKREEEERWLQERLAYLQQVKQLSEETKKQQQLSEQLNGQLEEAKKQILSLTQSQNQLQKQKLSSPLDKEKTEGLIMALQHRLHKRIERTNHAFLNQLNEGQIVSKENKKQKINFLKETVALIDYMESYLHLSTAIKPMLTDSTSKVERHEQPTVEDEETGHYGTFYRRDHGGYIELETGERFNISESLVRQLELQHEAEVLCIPNQTTGKSSHYNIRIVFQGDDAYSPITQYDGYIYSDSEGKWYCVDMNDESLKFPIHFKDIDIQKPAHGDPCSFNVANDGYIARLTKLYRLLPGETFETTFTTQKAEKAKTQSTQTIKEKQEPYLTGCTITIIGGQRKWFESVVKETGAELVHNGGEKPERIASDLARSQALFMILTSTSHRATWEGIEIAKANQIPHFTIQGSKSNLRSLLWENQQLIRETNRQ